MRPTLIVQRATVTKLFSTCHLQLLPPYSTFYRCIFFFNQSELPPSPSTPMVLPVTNISSGFSTPPWLKDAERYNQQLGLLTQNCGLIEAGLTHSGGGLIYSRKLANSSWHCQWVRACCDTLWVGFRCETPA